MGRPTKRKRAAEVQTKETDFLALLNQLKREEEGNPEGWYTTAEIADALGITPAKARERIKEGIVSGVLETGRKRTTDMFQSPRRDKAVRVKQ